MRRQFLWKVREEITNKKRCVYSILPDFDCFQDDLIGNLKRVKGVSIVTIGQQDGSRFRTLRSLLPPSDIIANIREQDPDRCEIWQDDEKMNCSGGRLEFYIIWLHTFLNGARVVPIVVNNASRTFKDMSEMFDGRASDGMGIIVPFNDEGPIVDTSGFEITPVLIKHQSRRKMCHCCGVVSDVSKPRSQPWFDAEKHWSRRNVEQKGGQGRKTF